MVIAKGIATHTEWKQVHHESDMVASGSDDTNPSDATRLSLFSETAWNHSCDKHPSLSTPQSLTVMLFYLPFPTLYVL